MSEPSTWPINRERTFDAHSNRRRGGCTRAAIFCDACGEEIRTAGDGNYHWRGEDEDDPRGAALFFSHKRCSVAVDEKHKTLCAMELDHLVVMLARNLGVDTKRAEARARFLHE